MVVQPVQLTVLLGNAIKKELSQAAGQQDLMKELAESLDGINSFVEDPNIRSDPAAVRRRMGRLKCATDDARRILGGRGSTMIALQESVDYLNKTLDGETDQGTDSFVEQVESILKNEHVKPLDPMHQTLLESVKSLKTRASGSRPARRSIREQLSHVAAKGFSDTRAYKSGE